jgi:hypothetical protein
MELGKRVASRCHCHYLTAEVAPYLIVKIKTERMSAMTDQLFLSSSAWLCQLQIL